MFDSLKTKENGAFWEGFLFGDTNLEAVHENGLRDGRGKQELAV